MSMEKFLTICFALISLLGMIACSPAVYKNTGVSTSNLGNSVSLINMQENKNTKLKTEINFQKAQLSGITVLKVHCDTILGAFISEFGLKGFEFIIYNNHCKVFNIMSKLNKWYIRNTLENDLLVAFNSYQTNKPTIINKKKYTVETVNNKIITISNTHKNKFVEQLTIENDSVFTLNNFSLNIIYRFQTLPN